MNMQILIGLFVAVVIAGGAWLLIGGDKAQAPTEETETESRNISTVTSNSSGEVQETFAGTGSFADLIGLGRNVTCDFTHEAETGSTVAGTIKVSGGKIRSDFEMQQAGIVYESHFIQDTTYMYTWSDSPQGSFAMKSPVEDLEVQGEADTAPGRTVDMDSDVEYECRAWTADASVFVPPSDITFMTPNEMMQNMMQQYAPSAAE